MTLDDMSVWGCVTSAVPTLSSGVLWCPLVSSGVLWCPLVSSGILWYPLVSSGILWCPLVSSGVLWCPLSDQQSARQSRECTNVRQPPCLTLKLINLQRSAPHLLFLYSNTCDLFIRWD
ncbi:hypothetical protein FSST1_005460 [Fusarium sambucinum]